MRMSILRLTENFYRAFKGEKGVIGKTALNKPVYYFCVQKSSAPCVIVTAGIHAREYITCYLALRLIKEFEKNGKAGRVFFLPMINPDGVEICLNGNPDYKANSRGVDLNVNFDAKWSSGTQNSFIRGEQNYVGESPFSEAETIALKNFTLKVKPNLTISYHSKGEEIYWEFFQKGKRKARDSSLARVAELSTGYKAKIIKGSAGGYKDWCVQKLKIPALTIEVGGNELTHPISSRYLNDIFNQNKNLLNDLILNL